MTTRPTKQASSESATVQVKRVAASGIVYDTASILRTAAAKHHIETLRRSQDGCTEKSSARRGRDDKE